VLGVVRSVVRGDNRRDPGWGGRNPVGGVMAQNTAGTIQGRRESNRRQPGVTVLSVVGLNRPDDARGFRVYICGWEVIHSFMGEWWW